MIAPKDMAEIAANYAAAWSSGNPEAVASFFAEDGQISINKGEVLSGRAAITDMAAGFYAEFPDLIVRLDNFRVAGDHALFAWTLEGHHSETKNHVQIGGWEEWELSSDGRVAKSLGWFDAAEYDRQVQGG